VLRSCLHNNWIPQIPNVLSLEITNTLRINIHKASYPMATGVSFPGSKAAET